MNNAENKTVELPGGEYVAPVTVTVSKGFNREELEYHLQQQLNQDFQLDATNLKELSVEDLKLLEKFLSKEGMSKEELGVFCKGLEIELKTFEGSLDSDIQDEPALQSPPAPIFSPEAELVSKIQKALDREGIEYKVDSIKELDNDALKELAQELKLDEPINENNATKDYSALKELDKKHALNLVFNNTQKQEIAEKNSANPADSETPNVLEVKSPAPEVKPQKAAEASLQQEPKTEKLVESAAPAPQPVGQDAGNEASWNKFLEGIAEAMQQIDIASSVSDSFDGNASMDQAFSKSSVSVPTGGFSNSSALLEKSLDADRNGSSLAPAA